MNKIMRQTIPIGLIFILIFLAACGEDPADPLPTQAAVAEANRGETAVAEVTTVAEPATATAVPPTATPTEPLAATINGRPLTLSDYEREVARYEQAQAQLGQPVENDEYKNRVLEALIERELIAQAAEAAGVSMTPQQVDAQMAELETVAGGAEPFNQWLALNQWTADSFRSELETEMIIGQMRDRITADVPSTSEQINARYIQVDDAELAQTLHQRALAGDDFAFLAQQNSLDQVTAPLGGELGFFAHGSLLVPEVEEAAFALQQPNEISEVIPVTDANSGHTTYYLVQLIERDMERPLSADQRYRLLQQAFNAWLDDLWRQAAIELLIETK